MPEFAEWDSFYVIVGSAAGGLIGLQFVVLTLIADRPVRGVIEGSAAFVTPTVFHFGGVLLVSALMRVPWPSAFPAAVSYGVIATAGLVYSLSVVRRMTAQNTYRPQLEDWIYYAVLPVAAYAILAVSALAVPQQIHAASFGIGAATLMLLFTGIHNAWDAVSYHVLVASAAPRSGKPPPGSADTP